MLRSAVSRGGFWLPFRTFLRPDDAAHARQCGYFAAEAALRYWRCACTELILSQAATPKPMKCARSRLSSTSRTKMSRARMILVGSVMAISWRLRHGLSDKKCDAQSKATEAGKKPQHTE